MEQRVSLITLGVADLARATAFYRAMGWTPSPRFEGADVTFFQAGGMIVALWPRAELAADAGLPADASGDTPTPRPGAGLQCPLQERRRRHHRRGRPRRRPSRHPAKDTPWGGSAVTRRSDGTSGKSPGTRLTLLADGSVRLPG